jgi:SAM-dependent methyltransferase
MEDRIAREREFHDARFAEGRGGRSADRFYAINEASDRFFRRQIEQTAKGGHVLDYGCGSGAYAALHAATQGYTVTAIDISPVAIEEARAEAERCGVADRIDFQVMNAESLDFPDDSFDMICGLGVIHHLELDAALSECRRVVRPDGRVAFVEPLGHNPLINLYRKRTPDQRSVDEHPLVMGDFEILHRYFREVTATYYHLLGLLALPLHGRRRLGSLLHTLDAADQVVFKTPMRRYAWMVGLQLAGPNSSG